MAASTALMCPNPHAIKMAQVRMIGVGQPCQACHTTVIPGKQHMRCKECGRVLCIPCAAKTAGWKPRPLTCPKGHRLAQVRSKNAGTCDGCDSNVVGQEIVTACESCNFWLCKTCTKEIEDIDAIIQHTAPASLENVPLGQLLAGGGPSCWPRDRNRPPPVAPDAASGR